MKNYLFIIFIALIFINIHAEQLKLVQETDKIIVQINGKAILTQVAKLDFRPYIHPIIAPDGKGELTEYSPGHHKHQTGLYWAFARVNGRKYFHNPGDGHFKRKSHKAIKTSGNEGELGSHL